MRGVAAKRRSVSLPVRSDKRRLTSRMRLPCPRAFAEEGTEPHRQYVVGQCESAARFQRVLHGAGRKRTNASPGTEFLPMRAQTVTHGEQL